jgi:hypothetical protein
LPVRRKRPLGAAGWRDTCAQGAWVRRALCAAHLALLGSVEMRAAEWRDAVSKGVPLAAQRQIACHGESSAERVAAGGESEAAGAADGSGADGQVAELRVEGARVPLLDVGEQAARLGGGGQVGWCVGEGGVGHRGSPCW